MKGTLKIFSLHLLSLLIVSSMILFTSSCESGKGDTQAQAETDTGDLAGLVFEDIPGSLVKYARQISAAGQVEIEGFVEDGKKVGQWIQYSPEGDITLINNYVDGFLEGTAMRMTFRNQVDLKTTYHKNMLHGPWTSYKYGKIIEQREYVNDKLDGVVKTFDDRTFKLKQEVQYKNGLQDGYFRYYDEEGNITLEYEYKNGEKIKGGIVEPK
jgi:antitoxin component YwqK of YwqJK toxin-antitoxin module